MAFYVLCDDDCRYPGMTAEQILTAIQQAVAQGYVSDPDSAVISKIKEINANGVAQIWVGTEDEFNALDPQPTINASVVRISTDGTMYICTDDTTLAKDKHADTHGVDGSDPITPESIGAQRTVTFGTGEPSGGKHGDIYIQIS